MSGGPRNACARNTFTVHGAKSNSHPPLQSPALPVHSANRNLFRRAVYTVHVYRSFGRLRSGRRIFLGKTSNTPARPPSPSTSPRPVNRYTFPAHTVLLSPPRPSSNAGDDEQTKDENIIRNGEIIAVPSGFSESETLENRPHCFFCRLFSLHMVPREPSVGRITRVTPDVLSSRPSEPSSHPPARRLFSHGPAASASPRRGLLIRFKLYR